MESDFQSMHADLNEALNARRAADERADRLQMEVNRLTEELRQVSTRKQNDYRVVQKVSHQVFVVISSNTDKL